MSMKSPQEETEVRVLDERETAVPPMVVITLHNDDDTPFEFVLEVLQDVFGRSRSEAVELAFMSHNWGRSVVGKYPREIAETLLDEANTMIQGAGHALRLTMDEIEGGEL
jgi:ATP-dependent Clp protease adaptor protein ClpS